MYPIVFTLNQQRQGEEGAKSDKRLADFYRTAAKSCLAELREAEEKKSSLRKKKSGAESS